MRTIALALSFGVTALAACDRAPSAEGLKEWSPTDHGGEQKSANQGARQRGAGGTATMVDVTWRQQCASCHGAEGHGDGPQGGMFKAANLSDEEWQSKVTDEEIAYVIVNGKNRMPKFDLPPEVTKGLVERVRSFRGK